MKNLYEILEVSKKASNEIIEKAYRTLVKKYHPDLQEEQNKTFAEEKMKEINEAYSILIDEQKRKEYDDMLYAEEQKELEKRAKDIANNQYNVTEDNDDELKKYYQNIEKQIQQDEENRRKEAEIYRQNYIQYMKSLGFKFKKKFTMKDFFVILIAIVVLVAVGYILWIIPPVHNWMINLYNDNLAVKLVVNVIKGIIKGFGTFFSNLFKSK